MNHPRFTVYSYEDGTLLASGVVLPSWVKRHGYDVVVRTESFAWVRKEDK